MKSFRPQVYDAMVANCEEDSKGCLVWKGECDEYGYPIFKTKRFKEAHPMRQDEKLFEHVTNQEIGDGVLVHTCGNRRCLEVSHMRLLTEAEDIREYDRMMTDHAIELLSEGEPIQTVMFETGLSRVRLAFLAREAKPLRLVEAGR